MEIPRQTEFSVNVDSQESTRHFHNRSNSMPINSRKGVESKDAKPYISLLRVDTQIAELHALKSRL
jgi:hypothetical protein